MALITIKFPQCGAPLHFQDNTSRATCEYCGAIVEDDVLREIQKHAIAKREAEKETLRKGFKQSSLDFCSHSICFLHRQFVIYSGWYLYQA